MVEDRARLISVIGAGSAGPEVLELARRVGGEIVRAGWGLVCGGMGGVMQAACQGASEAGGLTVGILAGTDPAVANPFVQVALPTGLGQGRNLLVVLAGAGAIAVSGGAGTLSEIGHALKQGKPVVGLNSWELPGMLKAKTPRDAVDKLLGLLERGPEPR